MIGTLTSRAIFIDTSAIVALRSESDKFHNIAINYFRLTKGVRWVVMNSTTHEAYTRLRYDKELRIALNAYDWLKSKEFHNIHFDSRDEDSAREILGRYHDQVLSYHDALCAALMIRIGLYRIFSFDSHFWAFGFQVEPGITK